jgi:hypothetical protein
MNEHKLFTTLAGMGQRSQMQQPPDDLSVSLQTGGVSCEQYAIGGGSHCSLLFSEGIVFDGSHQLAVVSAVRIVWMGE